MILRRLHLHPFAGSADREVSFAPGLNVVLGPNEAGKSTLSRALRQALFVPTKLTKRQAEEEVMPHLPLGGGDTIRVSIDLGVGAEVWKLTKRWTSGNSSAELVRPDGGLVTETTAVEEALAQLLGLTRGTWENVLIASQGKVGSSLDRLNADGDLQELNERLRRAVFETDGVSLEKLGTSLQTRWESSFGRWDRALKRPEANRGIENPWSRGAGRIVLAWYDREIARVALDKAESYYRRLDELNAALSTAVRANESIASWVASHELIAGDAEQRLLVEAELAKVEARGKGLKEVSQEWPVAENRRQEQESLAATLREKAVLLGQELAKAKAWDAAGKSRRLLEDADKLIVAISSARTERDKLGKVETAQITALETLEKERARLRARIEASSLRVRFAATRAITIETRSGVEEAVPRELGAEADVTFEAGGRVLVREATGAWEVEVSSGEIDVPAEEARYRGLGEETTALLAALGVSDLLAARTKRSAYQEKAQQVTLLEGQLAETLGPRTLEELRAEVVNAAGEDGAAPTRPLGDLAAEQARTESEAGAAERDAANQRNRIESWVKEHESIDALLDRIGDLRGEHRDLRKRLDELKPLPENCADAGSFLREFRARRETLEGSRAEVNRILLEKAEFSGAPPQFEPAEAAERLGLATTAYERACREGEAIARILRDFESLRAELDADTLVPWQKHLTEVLAPLTSARYLGISPDKGTASRNDETAIPFAVLSAGTRASLGLAVRLSMARWFLEGKDGFLLLDDPLVDLDPSRQVAAATMLRRFAEDKQVILLTCHPGHADILGGNRVAL